MQPKENLPSTPPSISWFTSPLTIFIVFGLLYQHLNKNHNFSSFTTLDWSMLLAALLTVIGFVFHLRDMARYTRKMKESSGDL